MFKSDKYEELRGDNNLYVESIEVLEKNIPFIITLYKWFNVETIKEIFRYCVESKTQLLNYSALDRICKFTRIEEQRKKKKLDFPVLRFLQDTKKWVEEDPARTKQDVSDYIDLYTCKYANTVKNVVVTDVAYLETIKKYVENLFDVIVIKGKSKNYIYNLRMFELLWDKKDDIDLMNIYGDQNTKMFFAEQVIDTLNTDDYDEDEAPDFEMAPKLQESDIEHDIPTIVHAEFDYFDYSEKDGSNNRFMRKQENTNKIKNMFERPSDSVKQDIDNKDNNSLFSEEELPF